MPEQGAVLGIDVGTQGARVTLIDPESGTILASSVRPFLLSEAGAAHEQEPQTWWVSVVDCCREVISRAAPTTVAALSVTSTSGTLVLTDARLAVLRPAVMWNDQRAAREADLLAELLGDPSIGTGFSIAKALWVRDHEPQVWERTAWVLSAGDWLTARILGADTHPVTDYSNGLKLGLDLDRLVWPAALEDVGMPATRLPRVAVAGADLGPVGTDFAAATGLPSTTRVRLGVTDATAAQIACGAVDVGDAVTTIGTGLSVKVVSARRARDDAGALYAHRQWDGGWITTGTSRCGGESIARHFPGEDWDAHTAARRSPSSVLVFPLTRVGETFPFRAPDATGFVLGDAHDRADLFRGYLEGVAHVERLALELMARSGAEPRGPQLTAGGGAGNDTWMTIRASMLGRPTARTATPGSSFGAAIVAAAGADGINETARRLVTVTATFDPDPLLSTVYSESHARFTEELTARGYLVRSSS